MSDYKAAVEAYAEDMDRHRPWLLEQSDSFDGLVKLAFKANHAQLRDLLSATLGAATYFKGKTDENP